MRILARYLTVIYLKNFAMVIFGLTALLFFFDFLSQLFNKDFPAHQLVIYNLFAIPDLLVKMIPPSVLMATVLTLSGLSRTNELTACYSIGIGLRQIMMVIFSLVFMISCIGVAFQDRILPPMYRERTTFYWRQLMKRSDFFLDVKQDKIWYRSKNLIYNLRTFDRKTQTIHGMAVYTFDDQFRLIQVMAARTAEYNSNRWTLHDGTITVFSEDDYFPMSKNFSSKELIINETPKDFQEIEKEVDGLRIKELFSYIARIRETGVDTKSYEVKFHYRLSLSFIPLVMCILAVPFSTRMRREGGAGRDMGIGLGFTLLYWILYALGLALGKNGTIPPFFAAWTPSIFFAGLAGLLIYFKRK